jgi:5-methylcytosine-specific restriction endonuclease McrA
MSVTYIPNHLRNLVYERAQGCCEYCLISETVSYARHQIDHVIAEKHGGQTTEDNLALSCAICNKYKGSDIASVDEKTGEIVSLFNPRKNIWSEHFKIENGIFIGLTPNARATIRLLQINNSARIEERKI